MLQNRSLQGFDLARPVISSPNYGILLHDGEVADAGDQLQAAVSGSASLDLAGYTQSPLTSTVNAGATAFPVTSAAGFTAGDRILLEPTGNAETLVIDSVVSNTINTTTASLYTHISAIAVHNVSAWETKRGWASFEGTRYFAKNLTAADSAVGDLGNGVMLLMMQLVNNATATSCVVGLGYDVTGAGNNAIQLRTDASGGMRMRIRNSEGFNDLAIATSGITIGEERHVAWLVDNRADQKKVYGYISGNMVNSLSTARADVNPATKANGKLTVGCGWNGSAQVPFTGSIRRLHIVNFGESMPSNIDALIKVTAENYGLIPADWSGV